MENRITIRDIMIDNLDDLFQGLKADCLYSDPPWGVGNLKYWRTMNKQKGHSVNWDDFINRIRFLYERHVNGPLFLETGMRFEPDLENVFGKPDVRYEVKYGSGKNILPCLLMVWGATPKISAEGKKGYDVPYSALSSYGKHPEIVFDCCVGLGTTAKVAKALGAACFANELNRTRAQKTMKILDFVMY
jgi:hypothetical protein